MQKTENTDTQNKSNSLLFWHAMKNSFYKYFYILSYAYICLYENAICFIDFFKIINCISHMKNYILTSDFNDCMDFIV